MPAMLRSIGPSCDRARSTRAHTSSGREPDGHGVDAVDQCRWHALDWSRQLHVLHPAQHLRYEGARLHPGQVRAEAEMGTATTKGQVRVGLTSHIETVGIDEAGLVPI